MVKCPACGEENIEGADQCSQCQTSLEFLSAPSPRSRLEQKLLRDRVSMLAPRQPVVVSPQEPIAEVLDLLVGQSIGCVLVVDSQRSQADRIVGIFSERDALLRLNTEWQSLGDRPVAEFMTPRPETIEATAQIAQALSKMDTGGYRHMPVTTGGVLTGVISIRDILDYITANLLTEVD
ncbi:MAG TPA: CBS domain-containing protein [Pirellulales bacterium]|jgi:CBS domain-containing protein|nr:CBS domain-containing protein [Pirellulales bacterium]